MVRSSTARCLLSLSLVVIFCNSLLQWFPFLAGLVVLILPVLLPIWTRQTNKSYFGKLFYLGVLLFTWLPFSALNLMLEQLNQVKLPLGVASWIFADRFWLLGLSGIIVIILYYLALRTLPGLWDHFTSPLTFKEAIKKSWQQTRGNFSHYARYYFLWWLILISFDLCGEWGTTLVTDKAIAIIYAVVFWLLKQVLVLSAVFFTLQKTATTKLAGPQKKGWYLGWGLLVVGIILQGILAAQTLDGVPKKIPLVISHRGVDGNNGVQNTILALKKTVQTAKPAYVELDIQETIDRRFIVSHDGDLRNLAHKNLVIADNSLDQLLQIKVSEKGKQAHLASFTNYLLQAKKLNQPLLVELKVNQGTSQEFSRHFYQLYGSSLTNKDLVHSMDLLAIKTLKQVAPKMRAGYILPFNLFSLNDNSADFYSLEYKTATRHFMLNAHKNKQAVYLWTIDSPRQALLAWALGADAVITDEPSKMNQVLATATTTDYVSASLAIYIKEMI